MKDGINEICNEEAGESQNASWVDCFEVLREELATFAIENPDVYIIFEYVLRKSGENSTKGKETCSCIS